MLSNDSLHDWVLSDDNLQCTTGCNRTISCTIVLTRPRQHKVTSGIESLQSVPKKYPEIGRFSVPIQKLLAVELNAVEERAAKGKEVPIGFDEGSYYYHYINFSCSSDNLDLRCYCKFHRECLLSCRHIFHLDTEVKVSTPIQWEAYVGRGLQPD